jgi:hypothetical protein
MWQDQRIERQWRDMTKEVTGFYKNIFLRLEEEHKIDFNDSDALYCLHFLFLTRINEDLQRYIRVWNNHKLSTERNRTPNQLLLMNQHVNAAIAVNEDEFGVEEVYDDDMEVDVPYVEVLPLVCPLNAQQYHQFVSFCRPLTLSDNIVQSSREFDYIYLETLAIFRMIAGNV